MRRQSPQNTRLCPRRGHRLARIAALYRELAIATGSVVVVLNRAVALAVAHGPAVGLSPVDEIASALTGCHLMPAVRGDLLARLGRGDEASAAFDRAASLTTNKPERACCR
jgi:predicted RNA polymerase sigma factor